MATADADEELESTSSTNLICKLYSINVRVILCIFCFHVTVWWVLLSDNTRQISQHAPPDLETKYLDLDLNDNLDSKLNYEGFLFPYA